MKGNWQDGWWNGEHGKHQFRVVNVLVPPNDKSIETHFDEPIEKRRFMWYEAYSGTIVQAVQVRNKKTKYEWFMFNDDGSGLYKITKGMGSPNVGHRSLPDDCKVIEEVSTENYFHASREKQLETEELVARYWHERDPEGWAYMQERMKSMREIIQRGREAREGAMRNKES